MHNHPKHQRTVTLQRLHVRVGVEVSGEREDEGMKQRRVKVKGQSKAGGGSWRGGGRTECIFMSLRLSSFWVIWLHRHKFWAPTFLGVSLQCTLIQLVCKLFLQSSLRSPLLFRYFSTLSTFWSADLFLHHLSLSCPPTPTPLSPSLFVYGKTALLLSLLLFSSSPSPHPQPRRL